VFTHTVDGRDVRVPEVHQNLRFFDKAFPGLLRIRMKRRRFEKLDGEIAIEQFKFRPKDLAVSALSQLVAKRDCPHWDLRLHVT